MRETKAQLQTRADQIVALLRQAYPNAVCALNHTSPLELLLATILSAQCTDERVNLVTAELFRQYRRPEDYVAAPRAELERAIGSVTFFRNKARSLQECCARLIEVHGGEVPQDLEALVQLAGVGRKTANVVLGNAFGIASGVVVDTHVARVTQRLALTRQTQPEKIETDLQKLLPAAEWINFSHRVITHGRQVCKARRPLCEACPLEALCPSSLLKGAKPSKK